MDEHKSAGNYIKQAKMLVVGLRRATQKNDLAQITKCESLLEALLTELAGQKISVELRLALKILKQQHEQTRASIDQQLEAVKNELFNLKRSKKRMRAYETSSPQHILVKA